MTEKSYALLRRFGRGLAAVLTASIAVAGCVPDQGSTHTTTTTTMVAPTTTLLPPSGGIQVECVGGQVSYGPVVGVTISTTGAVTRTNFPCSVVHGYTTMTPGIDQIECQRGTTTQPEWITYILQPGGKTYGINCVAGDIVRLTTVGGRFQTLCPDVVLYRRSLTGAVIDAPFNCTVVGGTLLPQATTSVFTADGAFDWNLSSIYLPGLVKCPASGSLALYFLGEGAPTANPAAFTNYSCTPGVPFDVSRV